MNSNGMHRLAHHCSSYVKCLRALCRLDSQLRTSVPCVVRYFTKDVDNGRNTVVSPAVIQQFLVDMKMRLEHGYTTIISQCPKITRSTQGSSHGKLFINTTSGHFVCEHCNKQGAWTDLVDNLLLLKTQRRKSTFTCFKDLDTVKPFLEENNQAKEVWSSC
ncbi:uncharacterized protein LOC118478586, partial [Aplysia californica]|uniref:Uncharacterized protein LOC118478586 n=1 Tax=Aplysia californica TaxID=6500 RepID=A0ABM1W108_APLCA